MKTNPLNPEDPRLTAWTLDEMSEAEREDFETDLERTPNSQQLLDEVAETAAEVREMFRMEEIRTGEIEIPALSASPKNIIRAEFWTTKAAAITAAAAGLVALIGVFAWIKSLDIGGKNERLRAELAKYEAIQASEDKRPEFLITILHRPAPVEVETQQLPATPELPPIDSEAPEQFASVPSFGEIETPSPKPVAVRPAGESGFAKVNARPESNFSLAIGDSSFAEIENAFAAGEFPQPESIRVEELVNHFPYAYAEPENPENGVSVDMEVAECPWNPLHRLVRIGMHGSVLAQTPADARVRVEFNPFKVRSYRLIGYAGGDSSMGASSGSIQATGRHTITALYEIEPILPEPAPVVERPSNSGSGEKRFASARAEEFPIPPQLLTLELGSERARIDLMDEGKSWSETSEDFRFAASVAAFGMWLTGEEKKARLNPAKIAEIAEQNLGADPELAEQRLEFVKLARRAVELKR